MFASDAGHSECTTPVGNRVRGSSNHLGHGATTTTTATTSVSGPQGSGSGGCPIKASHGGGGGGFPPLVLCGRALTFIRGQIPCIRVPAWFLGGAGDGGLSAGLFGVDGNNATGEFTAATSSVLLVLHLAAALVAIEACHVTVSVYRLRRRARARHQRQQKRRRQQEQEQRDAATAAELSPASTPTTTAIPSASHSAELLRGRRLVNYWRLVQTAVLTGTRKAPSVPTAPDAILAQAALLSRDPSKGTGSAAAAAATANGDYNKDGDGTSESPAAAADDEEEEAAATHCKPASCGDALLALPSSFAFRNLGSGGDGSSSGSAWLSATFTAAAASTTITSVMTPHFGGALGEFALRSPTTANSAALAIPIAAPTAAHRRRSTMPRPDFSATNPWLTLHLLWTDTVRYTVNTDEIRKLLLSYPDSFYRELASDGEDYSSGGGCNTTLSAVARPVGTEVQSDRKDRDGSVEAATTTTPTAVVSPPFSSLSPTASVRALREAAANLALVWRLTLMRRVYDALVVHEDTQRCADDLEELATYGDAIYRRCIAPWGRQQGNQHQSSSTSTSTSTSDGNANKKKDERSRSGGVSIEEAMSSGAGVGGEGPQLSCSPPRAWLHTTLALNQLSRLSRRLTVRSVASLFRYMYASSRSKYLSAAMLAVLTAVTSRVSAAGMRAREAVTQVLGGFYYGRYNPSNNSSPTSTEDSTLFILQVLSLCSFELIRLTVNTVLVRSSQLFIGATASQRRDAVKAQLYEALTHMPLSFFDLHSYDDIEQMVYYVNDLEGVDVHIHQYAFTAATTFIATRLALAQLGKEARVLVFGTVAAAYAIQWVGVATGRWYKKLRQQKPDSLLAVVLGVGSVPAGVEADDDADGNGEGGGEGTASAVAAAAGGISGGVQEEENTDSANCRDGIMLRGLEIIAAIPQLRPYGADVTLMTWWNNYITTRAAGNSGGAAPRSGGLFANLFADTEGQLAPALGSALLDFADWFLPLFTSVYGAHTAARCQDSGPATASGRLLDATSAVKAAVETALDAARVLGVMLNNSYKARVIERILTPRYWESVSAEDIVRVQNYAQEHSWDAAGIIAPPPVMLLRKGLANHRGEVFRAASAAAHSAKTYRHLMVTAINVDRLQFAYPSNPTVPVFAEPFTASIVLQNPETGRGRFVCLTGPSGQGKSTMLHLLLGLYTNYYCIRGEDNGGDMDCSGDGEGNKDDTMGFANNGNRTGGESPIELTLTYKSPSVPLMVLGMSTTANSTARTSPALIAALPPAVFTSPVTAGVAVGVMRSPTTAAAAAAAGVQPSPTLQRQDSFSAHLPEQDYRVCLRDIPRGVLRGRLFSYVPQYPTIFSGATIAHNISLQPRVSIEDTALLAKAKACAEDAHCDYIQRFPQGLLTPVGDTSSLWSGAGSASPTDGRGLVRLSGGQAQRLMVARALYHGGSILLMDEPTASLDAVTKADLLAEWRELLESGVIKGIICATHDEAVMAMADEVISLMDG